MSNHTKELIEAKESAFRKFISESGHSLSVTWMPTKWMRKGFCAAYWMQQQRIADLERSCEMFKAGIAAADDKLIELQARNNDLEREVAESLESSVECNNAIESQVMVILKLERQLAEESDRNHKLELLHVKGETEMSGIFNSRIHALHAQLAEAQGSVKDLTALIVEVAYSGYLLCGHEGLNETQEKVLAIANADKALAAEVVG